MFPSLLLALAPLAVPDPSAPWELVEACPRLVIRGDVRSTASAVVIGQKDGFAYLLTAHHAVADGPPSQVQFFTLRSYPEPARTLTKCEVVKAFRQPDFALLKVPTGDTPVPVLKLSAPPPRPRKVPFAAISIGCSNGDAPTGGNETVSGRRFGKREGGERAFFWETEQPPTAGRSGGPLVADGKVLGVCAAENGGRGYYAHLDELLAGLKAEGYGWLWE